QAGAARQDGPGGGSQLPYGHVGAVFRPRLAGRYLVRKVGPQYHGYAQFHPPAVEGGAAVLGGEERLADFRTISKKFSELAAKHFPEPVEDLVATPLAHDTAAEIAQPAIRDWMNGEVEAIPGKSMPLLRVVRRDYKNLYNQFISFGPMVPKNGLGAHGTHYRVEDLYEESLLTLPR